MRLFIMIWSTRQLITTYLPCLLVGFWLVFNIILGLVSFHVKLKVVRSSKRTGTIGASERLCSSVFSQMTGQFIGSKNNKMRKSSKNILINVLTTS